MSVTTDPERYCVVALFDALDAGHLFERSAWPAHITLASNFVTTAAAEQIVASVRRSTGVNQVLRVQFGERALFGPRAEVPVRLVNSPRIEALHRDIVDQLDPLDGFTPDEPSHWHAGYRPHLTLRPTVDASDGEIRTATHIAIARLTSDTAEVVACMALRRTDAASVRAVGFDLDDTLFDHRGSAADAVAKFTLELGCEPTPERVSAWFDLESEHFESWRAGSITFAEQRRLRLGGYLRILGANWHGGDRDRDQLFETYLRHYRGAWRAFPGTASVLRGLRARGIRIGVLTNGNHEQQIDKLHVIGLAPLIDVVCTSEDIGVAKPDPRAFEILAARLGCARSEMSFIGDNLELDVAAARAAGIPAALVRHDGHDPAALSLAIESAYL